jgi:hypothetical protein
MTETLQAYAFNSAGCKKKSLKQNCKIMQEGGCKMVDGSLLSCWKLFWERCWENYKYRNMENITRKMLVPQEILKRLQNPYHQSLQQHQHKVSVLDKTLKNRLKEVKEALAPQRGMEIRQGNCKQNSDSSQLFYSS